MSVFNIYYICGLLSVSVAPENSGPAVEVLGPAKAVPEVKTAATRRFLFKELEVFHRRDASERFRVKCVAFLSCQRFSHIHSEAPFDVRSHILNLIFLRNRISE